MKKFQLAVFTLSVFTLALVGCKKDDANPIQNTPPTPPSFSTPQLTNFGGPTPTNVLAAIRTVTTMTLPVVGTQYIDANTGVAVFGTPGADKGDVKIVYSGTNYPFTKNTVSGAVSYAYVPSVTNPTGIPLSSGATTVTFNVSGYALAAANVVVPGQVRLSAPTDSVISKSAGVVISWIVSGGAGSKTAVYITDAAGHFKFYENMGAINTYTIPAADISGFTNGYGFLGVVTYNYVLTNSNQAVLIGECAATKTLTIAN
ncbi:MAG: hypothetical protein HY961_20605 [Ignavibacteriae bacterium]|nr:hypothetical protein [Ignavibacteriota bacterium]